MDKQYELIYNRTTEQSSNSSQVQTVHYQYAVEYSIYNEQINAVDRVNGAKY